MTAYKQFRSAGPDDLAFILAREADPANTYIHRWSEAEHAGNLGDAAFHYLIAEDTEGAPLGYAILMDNPDGRIEWRRVVVTAPGKGIGKAFMKDVLAHFTQYGSKAIWLDVYEENARARHVYAGLGFRETHRETLPKDDSVTLVFMEYRP